MARKIVFSADDAVLFRLAHEGFLATARGTSRQEHKLIDKILDHLDSISTEDSDGAIVPGFDPKEIASPKRRHLDPANDGIIIFEDAEYEYFKKCIDQVSCSAVMSKSVTKLNDVIDAAAIGDAKTLAAVAA